MSPSMGSSLMMVMLLVACWLPWVEDSLLREDTNVTCLIAGKMEGRFKVVIARSSDDPKEHPISDYVRILNHSSYCLSFSLSWGK